MLGLRQIAWLEPQRLFESRFLWSAIALLVVVTLVSGSRLPLAAAPAKQPPPLGETVPFVSNAYQYLTHMKAFLRREGRVRMYLGPIKLYLVVGAQNVRAMFKSSAAMSSDAFMIRVVATVWDASPGDVAKFASDKSGRLKVPAPGAEDTPPEARYWAGMHHLMHAHLARMHPTNKLAETYYREYAKHLERFPVGERVTRNVLGFLNNDIAEAAITSLCGTRILEVAPDLVWKRSDRFKAALSRYLDAAWDSSDWSGPDADADWASAGVVNVTGVFALNANTVPIAAWCIMELAKDPLLLESALMESLSAYVTDPATGALVQAPAEVAHYNEHVWSADEHLAPEFWGARFVSYVETTSEDDSVEKVPQFSMAERSGQWFPYGTGGVSICPERHFAQQEIMMSIAMLVARFDVDFVEWTALDGALPSDRPSENDPLFVGTAAVPPDRDMKVGLRRLW
ncbi:hypothetical protein LZ31DRAFT_587526 [Colletotrichum somersetense]|nr:hypothetical protein LZ31DRAFT_587526 [Colletotrichum somersetense]